MTIHCPHHLERSIEAAVGNDWPRLARRGHGRSGIPSGSTA